MGFGHRDTFSLFIPSQFPLVSVTEVEVSSQGLTDLQILLPPVLPLQPTNHTARGEAWNLSVAKQAWSPLLLSWDWEFWTSDLGLKGMMESHSPAWLSLVPEGCCISCSASHLLLLGLSVYFQDLASRIPLILWASCYPSSNLLVAYVVDSKFLLLATKNSNWNTNVKVENSRHTSIIYRPPESTPPLLDCKFPRWDYVSSASLTSIPRIIIIINITLALYILSIEY